MTEEGELDIKAEGKGNIQTEDILYLNSPKLRVRDSRYVYGLDEPSDLTHWTNIEEGTIYFKILD